MCSARKSLHVSCRLFEKAKITEKQRRVLPRTCMICRLFLLTENHLHAGIYRRWRIAPSPLGTWRAGCRRYALPGRQQIPACRWFSVNKKSLQIMQVRGKTRWCFSVILAFSKSLHESCRLFAFYRRAAHFFFLQAVYLGLTLTLRNKKLPYKFMHARIKG